MKWDKLYLISALIFAVLMTADGITTIMCVIKAAELYGYSVAIQHELNPVARWFLAHGIPAYTVLFTGIVLGFMAIVKWGYNYVGRVRYGWQLVSMVFLVFAILRAVVVLNNIQAYLNLTGF